MMKEYYWLGTLRSSAVVVEEETEMTSFNSFNSTKSATRFSSRSLRSWLVGMFLEMVENKENLFVFSIKCQIVVVEEIRFF